MNGAEVQSSEEALAQIDKINDVVRNCRKPPTWNVLTKFNDHASPTLYNSASRQVTNLNKVTGKNLTHETSNKNLFNTDLKVSGEKEEKEDKDNKNEVEARLSGDFLITERHGKNIHIENLELHDNNIDKENSAIGELDNQGSDDDTVIDIDKEAEEAIDILTALCQEANKTKDKNYMEQSVSGNGLVKQKITDFFQKSSKTRIPDQEIEWQKILSDTARHKYESSDDTLNNRLVEVFKSGNYWAQAEKLKDNSCSRKENDLKSSGSFQDSNQKPVMVGCDVVGLYPNLDPIGVAQITAEAVRNTKIEFKGINFYFLVVYLTLVLGRSQMEKMGLSDCIPRRKMKGTPNSLASILNKDMTNWSFENVKLNTSTKRNCIAIMLQLMVLLLTSTTCYKF